MSKSPEWFPNWSGETIVLVASGPSAVDVDIEKGIGRARFIAINNSWKLCPWADCVYGSDFPWWNDREPEHPPNAERPELRGKLLVSVDPRVKSYPRWNVRYLHCNKPDDRLLLNERGTIGWGGNSGFGSANFSAQLDPEKIIFVGFDMTKVWGAHWHEPHSGGLSNPTHGNIARWRKALDNAAQVFASRNITVINCSPISQLAAYPKMSFDEALNYRPGDGYVPLPELRLRSTPMVSPIPPDEMTILDPIENCKSMLELGNKKNRHGTYKAYFRSLGIDHVSVDLNGADGALALDLQKPLGLGRRFDYVTNFGTSEHVDDQEPCWRNIVEHTGDMLVSTTPMPGDWSWHGRWYPRPEFFQVFADYNGFAIERFYTAGAPPRRMYFARMKRTKDVPFKMPPMALFYDNRTGKKVGMYGR